jgi:hypothetical protein
MQIPIIGSILKNLGIGGSPSTDSNRPEPLIELANLWGPVHSLAAAGITAATTLGVLSSKSGGFLNKGLSAGDVVMAAIPAVLAGVAPLMAAHTVASIGRDLVTPLADPVTH